MAALPRATSKPDGVGVASHRPAGTWEIHDENRGQRAHVGIAAQEGCLLPRCQLSIGRQIQLSDNPLHPPLSRSPIKPRLVGHWGTTPG